MTRALSRRAIRLALVLGLLFSSATNFSQLVYAQRPTDPLLLAPQQAPALDYVAVPKPVTLPDGMTTGAPASVAFDRQGHLWILYRGRQPFAEFDGNGTFIRAFGDNLMVRPHGLRFDAEGNIWATDVAAHIVMKVSVQGKILLTLGEKGQRGLINEPNDIAFGPTGDVFVAQGHTAGVNGDPRVLKFDKTGTFVKSWGGKGKGPGQFEVAHGIAIDAKGQVWVADRENQRIQIFDQDGDFIRELKYAGLPCSVQVSDRYVYMVNGFAGQLLRLNLDGQVLSATGKSGTGVGEFGEAHAVAVSPTGELWVADPVNAAIQKFVKR